MERVFWLLLDNDGTTVKKMMEEFQHSHRVSLPENHRKLVPVIHNLYAVSLLGRANSPVHHVAITPSVFLLQLSQVLSTGTVSDEGILETTRRCWEENQYLLCPHTAVAVWHHYQCAHSFGISRLITLYLSITEVEA